MNVSHAIKVDSWFIDRFSSFSGIIEATIKVIKFIGKLSKKYNEKLEFNFNDNESKAKETKNAILLLCKITQRRFYLNEIKLLESGAQLPRKSSLYTLSPILKNGLIRVSGRLQNSSLNEDEKYPIILPTISHFVELLISYYHDVTMHGGIKLILSHIRKMFWVPRLKERIKMYVNNCVKCKRYKATVMQKMADLPPARVQISRPFSRVGIRIYTYITRVRYL